MYIIFNKNELLIWKSGGAISSFRPGSSQLSSTVTHRLEKTRGKTTQRFNSRETNLGTIHGQGCKCTWLPFYTIPPLIPKSVRELTKPHQESHAVNGIQFKLDPNSDLIKTTLSLCRDCMILWAQADIGDKDGVKLDLTSGIYNHHIIATDYGRRMVSPPIVARCADGRMGGFNFDLVGMKGGMGGMSGMSHGRPSRTKRQLDIGKLIGDWRIF